VPSSLAVEVERCPGCRTKVPVPPEHEPASSEPVVPEPPAPIETPTEPEPAPAPQAPAPEDEPTASPEQKSPEEEEEAPPPTADPVPERPAEARPRYSSRKRKRRKRMLRIGGGAAAVVAAIVVLWIWWPGGGATVLRHARSASVPTPFGRTIDPSGQPYLYLVVRKPEGYKPSTQPQFRFTGRDGAELECVREIESGDARVMATLKPLLSGAWGENILADDELLLVLKTFEDADSVTIRPVK